MTQAFLGVDAGGTSTRAVLVLADGTCVAQSRQPGGNPTSRGVTQALTSMIAAVNETTVDRNVSVQQCFLAMAGEREKIDVSLLASATSLPPEVIHLSSDVEAMYFSGAFEPEGTAVIAGTGSITARIVDGGLTEVAGGAGWLLGDGGSGFWIGQQVIQAVVGDLSGLMPPTAMTPLVLAALDSATLEDLVRETYAGPPVQLSQLAPIAFEFCEKDVAAQRIVERAGEHLTGLIERFPARGPLVLGGSVFTQGFLPRPGISDAMSSALNGRDLRVAENGGAGAAFLALRQSGLGNRATHERIRTTLHALAQ